MSQKIDGTASASASLRSSGASGRVSSAGSAVKATSPSDSVTLTGESTDLQALQRRLSQAPAVDSSRVDSVRQSLQDGSYRIDASNIASRMQSLDQQLAG